MNKRIGVSMASYLPWSAFFPSLASYWAKEDGFHFLMVLPFRGMANHYKNLALPIEYLEDAWNPAENIFQIFSKKPGSPYFHDLALFPFKQRAKEVYREMCFNIPMADKIVYQCTDQWRVGDLLEVSPKLGMSAPEIAQWAKNKEKPLVLDLCHLRRNSLPRWDEIESSDKKLGDWPKSLPQLLPYTSLVHIQPFPQLPPNELEKIMKGQRTELEEMLCLIKSLHYRGPFLIEATLGMKSISFWKLRLALCKMRELAEKYI